MLVDPSGFCGFNTITNLHIFQSADDSTEIFYLHYPDESTVNLSDEKFYHLKRASRFIERFYLAEVPFIIVVYDNDVESYHIGWGLYLPHIESWNEVLGKAGNDVIVFNQLGYRFFLSHEGGDDLKKPENTVYDLDVTKILEWHKESNIQLFFMRSK